MQHRYACTRCGELLNYRPGLLCDICKRNVRKGKPLEKKVPPKFVGDSFEHDFGYAEEFFPSTFGIMKEKQGLIR